MKVVNFGCWRSPSAWHGYGPFNTGFFSPVPGGRLLVSVAMMGARFTGDVGLPIIEGGGITWEYVGQARGEPYFGHRMNLFSGRVFSGDLISIIVDDGANKEIFSYCVSVVEVLGDDVQAGICGFVSSGLANIGSGAYSMTLTDSPGLEDVSFVWVMESANSSVYNVQFSPGWEKLHEVAGPAGGSGIACAVRRGSVSRVVEILDVYNAAGTFYKASAFALFLRQAADDLISPGERLWMLANSYHQQIVEVGLGEGPGKPAGDNAAEWGGVFFGSP